jgi:hypothetical protein
MSDQMRDDQLIELLARALDSGDPVPESVLEAAKASFTWRTIDAELASLVFDSAAEDLVGVRSVETTRQLTFSTPGVEIELVVLSEDSRRLIGQLVPPQTAEIVLHSRDEERRVTSDSLGRFTLHDVPTGSVRLTCVLGGEDGATVQTEWTII